MSKRRSPLQLDDEALRRLSPIEVAQAHQDAINRMLTTRRLTLEQWDALIGEWNEDLTDEDRRRRLAACTKWGHDWTRAPIGARVCRRCLAYTDGDR